MNRPLLFALLCLATACSSRGPLQGHRLDSGHYRLGVRVDERSHDVKGTKTVEVCATEPAVAEGSLKPVQHGSGVLLEDDSRHEEPLIEPRREDEVHAELSAPLHPRNRSSSRSSELEEDTARTKWNWFAIASSVLLIAGLAVAIPLQSTELLLLGCALALAAAIIGARQCRDRDQRGQGFAMATMGFAAAGVLVAIIALLSRL